MIAPILLSLSLSVAEAHEPTLAVEVAPDAPFELFAPTPVFFAAEPTADSSGVDLSSGMGRVDMVRYSAQMRTARTGLILGIASIPFAMGGSLAMLGGALAENEGVFLGGVGLLVGGGLMYVAGAPIMNAGAHAAARTLHRGHVDVPVLPSIASWAMMSGGVALTLIGPAINAPSLTSAGGAMFLGSYIVAGVQMGVNGRYVPGPQFALAADPVNRGIRLAGRF
ncbi:MAG: hypothetical protein KC912_08505 [Proteobacteria bacterium]|nr:hypothetical protein [Pseudomonadota bacterium]